MTDLTAAIKEVLDGECAVIARFLSHIKITDSGCWEWQGAKNHSGYGTFHLTHTKAISAYKYLYEIVKGKVPEGLELDHLCRNHACVNPSHLEAVTHSVNVLRGNSPKLAAERQTSKTHCPKGHLYSLENTRFYKGGRWCRICNTEATRKRRAAARIADRIHSEVRT